MNFEIKNGVLRKYTGSEPIVVIPDGVNEIDIHAFVGCDDVVEVTLPECVAKVGMYAFAECKGLERVHILGDVILEKGAFYKCEKLKELNVVRGLKEFEQSAFFGCPKLESAQLSDRVFELYTLISDRSSDEILYPNDTDISKKAYSWEEYKKITSEVLAYALIYSKDHCNEIEGPETPEIRERNTPVTDDMLVVKDGHFFGCVLEKECTVYVNGKCESQKSLVLLKPDDKPINIQSMSASHLPFYAHLYVDAFFRRCDRSDEWIGKVNDVRKVN